MRRARSFQTPTRVHGKNTIRVKSFRDVLREYQTHPEAKSAGPDREPCTRLTSGVLRRRSVQALPFGPGLSAYIGKESNRQEDVEGGLVGELGEVVATYEDMSRETWLKVWLPQVRKLAREELAKATGMSKTQITEMLSGRSLPRISRQKALLAVVVALG